MMVKKDFPIFIKEPDLIDLDSAATTHKPAEVVDAVAEQLAFLNGSPHRGAHRSSVRATEIYTETREVVRQFIGAKRSSEIVFTKNATEALNLIAYGYGLSQISSGQNLVVAITSHHSNLVPWQMVAKATGAELRYLYLERSKEGMASGAFSEESLLSIDAKTALVAFPVVSNGYGMVHPVKGLIDRAKAVGAVTVLDGAQAVGHMAVDMMAWDCDFFVFSGHKIFAPQGVGVLYGRQEVLEKVEPFLRGGDMIEYVTEQAATFAALPERLEAGTQNVTAVYGLKVAIEYLKKVGFEKIRNHERQMIAYAIKRLTEQKDIRLIGPATAEGRGALVAFNLEGVHPHDVASLLDARGIAIRAGHHCCQPLMQHLGEPSSCRISFTLYNDFSDIDALMEGLDHIREVFGIAR